MTQLSYLVKLYKQRLSTDGVETPNVHPTRLKENMLVEMPIPDSHQNGLDILLAFYNDVGYVFCLIKLHLRFGASWWLSVGRSLTACEKAYGIRDTTSDKGNGSDL